MKSRTKMLLGLSVLFSMGCNNDSSDVSPAGRIDPGNDPNFTIVQNSDAGFDGLNRKVEVFEIPIYAVAEVEDERLLHAANIMAQYLDNDEDGKVDNQEVWQAMKDNKAYLFMWKSEADEETVGFPSDGMGQDLGNDETIPSWHANGHTGRFDASLEEVLHLINFSGHVQAYPEAFGLNSTSLLAQAMDVARGGHFETVPASYPDNAWYTYDDETCGYADCQTIEYLYWALTSILGAQENRLDEIGHEWKLNTKAKVESTDQAIYDLLTDPKYKFPTTLPDGTYKH